MKLIAAVVQPEKLASIQTSLNTVDIRQMTVNEVFSYGQEEGHTLIYRSSKLHVRLVPKLKLEIAVEDGHADQAVAAIRASAGEGMIFVFDLEDCVQASAMLTR